MQENLVQSLGLEPPLQEEIATHSSILAWKIPWTEEPGGLQSTGLQRVTHDWAHTHTSLFECFLMFLILLFCYNTMFSAISSVQSLSHVRLFATWTTACQASLSITNSWSPPKPMSMKSVMPSNHLILCRPLLLPPSIFPSIRVFSNESTLRIRWPKY